MATVKPVKQWELGDAKAAASADLPPDFEINRKAIEDHDWWQEGTLWPGHRTGDPVTDAALRANIKPQFISDDVVGECVDNRSAGLLGQEADVALIPLTAESAAEVDETAEDEEADAVLADLAAWWDRIGLWPLIRETVNRITYGGRAGIRAIVPQGVLDGGTLPTRPTLAEALGCIELDAPRPDRAVRYVDPTTQITHAIIVTTVNDQEQAEVWTLDPVAKTTSVKILGGAGGTMGPFDLKGRLPLATAKGLRLVTPSVRSLQAQLNFVSTVTTRVVEMAGHRERYLGNVEPPGMWLPYPPSSGPALDEDDSNPAQKFWKHRVQWSVGANITTELVGLPQTERDPDGTERVSYSEPSVTSLDPVDPLYATNAAAVITRRIARRMKQGHLNTDATAEASGVAYQQARAQHEADLNALRAPVELLLRDLLEAVLAYAGLIYGGAAGLLDRYRVQVTLHPVAGPVTADEARLAVELRDKRAISGQEMMSRLGVEDPVAEQDAIESDPTQNAALWGTLTATLQTLMGLPNMQLAGAGWLLGLDDDTLTVLATGLPPAGEGPALPGLRVETAPTPTEPEGNGGPPTAGVRPRLVGAPR